MNKFNQTIQIEIEVDSIAQQLRQCIHPDFVHGDALVEQIIGRALSNDTVLLGRIMSAMNGFQKEIIVKIGDNVKIAPKQIRVYGFWTPESIEKNDTVYGDITDAVVTNINKYSDNPVLIEFEIPKKDGTFEKQSKWVNPSIFIPETI